jgi:predicted CopG family antitoxin
MSDYNRLPSQQFSNIIKRYIQHRKATELEDRIQSETFDKETKNILEKMGSFYEQVCLKQIIKLKFFFENFIFSVPDK